jgi:integrase
VATITYFENGKALSKKKDRKRWRHATSVRAQIRMAEFKSTAKHFPVITTPKAAFADAQTWADAMEKELQAQAVRGGARHDVTQLTIGELIRQHLADPETNKLKSYGDVERLLAWWKNSYAADKVLDFGVLTLRSARDKKLHTVHGPATTNRYLSAMRACWNWGRAAGLVPLERSWPSRLMLTEPRGRTRFLSDDELTALLEAAESDVVVRAAIMLSLSSGLRQGELLRLKWSDLDLSDDKARVTVHESKNNEKRAVHVTAEAVAALKQLRKLPVVSPVHVFINASGKPLKKSLLEGRWYKIRTAAKLADFHWHDLRHTCASILLQNGSTLPMVGSVLGHKSPGMTMRYSHLVAGAPVTGHDKLDEKLRGK